MKSLFLSAIFITLGFNTLLAQSISVSVGETPDGPTDTVFLLGNGVVAVSSNQVILGENEFYMPYSWTVSPDRRKVSFLLKESEFIYQMFGSNGYPIFEKSLEFFSLQDETAKAYLFDDGRSVLRDNVANFSFFSSSGEQLYSVSNSSQSTEGEKESELASDKSGQTIVLYNPVINYGSSTGSRASIVTKGRNLDTFFRDRQREISSVNVTAAGNYITVIVKPEAGSEEYRALIYDRFGNKLFEQDTEEELKGVDLTPNADFVTLYSSGRMQVYRLGDAERIGSASSRSSLLYATYDPDENMIIALGGNINGYSITNPSITAVHIGQRQIESEEINDRLHTLNGNSIRLVKEGVQQFSIQNLDRTVRIQTSF
jgi:hypothetical protein